MLRFIEEYNYSWSWQNKKKLLLGYVNAIKSRIKACKVTFMWQFYSLVGSGTCNSCREQTSIYILQIHTNLVTILNVIEGRKGTTHYSANMIMYLKSWNNPRQISTATWINFTLHVVVLGLIALHAITQEQFFLVLSRPWAVILFYKSQRYNPFLNKDEIIFTLVGSFINLWTNMLIFKGGF